MSNIRGVAKIVGRGDIHRRNLSVTALHSHLNISRGDPALTEMLALVRIYPHYIKIEQSRRTDKGRMDVSRRQDQGSLISLSLGNESEHSLYRQGRALGGIKTVRRAIELGEIILALGYDAICRIEHVSARYFGNVKSLATKHSPALVSGHMISRAAALGIFFYKIKDWCCHFKNDNRKIN